MPPEATAVSAGGDVPARGLSAAWRAALVRLSLAWAALMVLFASDWAAMVGQWWNSSTYNHMLLVPAIIAWLVWLRVPQLVRLVPQPWWPGLGLVAAATLLWVLGALAAFSLVTEAGAVALLIASVPTLLGPRVAAGLLFPLGYMAFLVPFGDELIPALQMITARLTIALTALSHVPAVIDGVFINTPAGLFEVAEACSGVKFLIAMVAFGVLVANVCFRSWWRRAAFLAIAVATPILANGVRAWGTIYVAQYKGAAWAGGFDHIVYGWIFFAVVIAVTIALAWRFFDRPSTDPMIDGAALAASLLLARLSRLQMPGNAALAAIVACAVAGLAWASAADRLSAPLPRRIELPEVAGWHRVAYRPQVWWEPRATGAEHRLLGRYDDGQGHQVDVFFALYASQNDGKEAGGFGEGALPPGRAWAWQSPGPAVADANSDRLLAHGRIERVAESTFRTGSLVTGSNLRLKLANIADRLLLRRRTTMLLILSTEQPPGSNAAAALGAFRRAAGPLGPWMDRIAQGR